MNITAGSDLLLKLHLKTVKGKEFRVSDCSFFKVKVFTSKNKTALLFDIDDIEQDGKRHDKIHITADKLEFLDSGVIQYTVEYMLNDSDVLITTTFVSDVYFTNPNKNTLNSFTVWVEGKIKDFKDTLDENSLKIDELEYKLLEEIKRSMQEDIEIREKLALIDPDAVEENVKQILSDYYNKEDIEDKLSSKLDKATYEEEKKNFLTADNLSGYATQQWVEGKKYLTEHQSLENYYTKSEVDKAIQGVDVSGQLTDYLSKEEATKTYQPKGEYVSQTEFNELQNTVWDCASQDSLGELENVVSTKLNKSEYEADKPTFLTKEEASSTYQEKGNYLTNSDIANLATKSELSTVEGKLANYQPKGDYALKSDIPTDYVTQSVLDNYAKIWSGSQEAYDSLEPKDNNTLYIIL